MRGIGWMMACASPLTLLMACGRADLSPDIGGAGGKTSVVHSAFGDTALALGEEHTCVRRVYGDVVCIGRNENGQLGVPGTMASSTPIAVTLPGLAKSIAGGPFHTCAVLVDNSVYCWGGNASGEVGVTASPSEPSPVRVPLPPGIVLHMSLGRSHTCVTQHDAISESTLYCWGANTHGQVGVGTVSPTVPPSQIAPHVAEIALGNFHTDGIIKTFKPDGESSLLLGGFGDDAFLELGFAGNQIDAPQTSIFLGLSNLASGAADHGCAAYDGTPMQQGGQPGTPGVYCWGRNDAGQLGRGTLTTAELPGPVSGFSAAATSVAVSETYSCAVVQGSISCWGVNDAGQFGNGTKSTTPSPKPTPGPAFTGVKSIGAATSHACAVVTNSDVECWGSNANGELGDGTTTNSPKPVKVALPP